MEKLKAFCSRESFGVKSKWSVNGQDTVTDILNRNYCKHLTVNENMTEIRLGT